MVNKIKRIKDTYHKCYPGMIISTLFHEVADGANRAMKVAARIYEEKMTGASSSAVTIFTPELEGGILHVPSDDLS